MRKAIAMLALLALAACGGSNTPASTGAAREFPDEPALQTPQATLDQALYCTHFAHPDKTPVLLVHGTFTAGFEQYDWTYLPLLADRGYDVCLVTYPDRGLGDQQVSAEFVVNALRRIHAATGRKVAMIGHSQGAAMPRWALKWWKSARDATGDFVAQAAPHHGTLVADQGTMPTGQPASTFQFRTDSQFVAALNRGDETPGDVDWTNLYTQYDELVQPVTPVPTAALEFGQDNPRVANLLLQALCGPGHVVDHVTIGLTDRIAFELTLDAIANPGPANVERAGGAALCGMSPIVVDQVVYENFLQAMFGIWPKEEFALEPHLTREEPPLKPYVQ